jgi:malate dehydrogenase
MFGFPVRSNGKTWEIVQGLNIMNLLKKKFNATLKELLEEKEAVQEMLG